MSELLKKQKFGVEVEFTGITREMAAKAVQEIVGGTISGPKRDAYYTRTIKDSQRRTWKVMRDSSISPKTNVGTANIDEYRVEFVTPPLKYEDIETLQNIIRKFKEIGGVPHSSCGIHIHIDGANHTATSLRRMVNFMLSRQEIIYEASVFIFCVTSKLLHSSAISWINTLISSVIFHPPRRVGCKSYSKSFFTFSSILLILMPLSALPEEPTLSYLNPPPVQSSEF